MVLHGQHPAITKTWVSACKNNSQSPDAALRTCLELTATSRRAGDDQNAFSKA
jgi:hypothetical protein